MFGDMAQREVASILRCDLSLMISDFEVELLKNTFGVSASLLHHLPFMLDPAMCQRPLPSFEQRANFISIGNGLIDDLLETRGKKAFRVVRVSGEREGGGVLELAERDLGVDLLEMLELKQARAQEAFVGGDV